MNNSEIYNEKDDGDFDITDLPIFAPFNLRGVIEFRVQLRIKQDIILEGGIERVLPTYCSISVQPSYLTMHLKRAENVPILFDSEGVINQNFRGRINVKIVNYNLFSLKLNVNTIVGYLIIQPNIMF